MLCCRSFSSCGYHELCLDVVIDLSFTSSLSHNSLWGFFRPLSLFSLGKGALFLKRFEYLVLYNNSLCSDVNSVEI